MTSIYAENHQKKVKILQKVGSKHLNTDKKVFPGRLIRAGHLFDLHEFSLRTFIKDRTSIRETREISIGLRLSISEIFSRAYALI